MRASVFIATSLDGYIARPNGDIDWLPTPGKGKVEDYGYGEFMSSIDVLVMGRLTFEKVLTFEAWPYEGKRVVVLSSGCVSLPEALREEVEVSAKSPRMLIEELSGRGFSHAYIDGGKTIQGFLRAGLIQMLTIAKVPVLLGEGVPLFGELEQDVSLTHIKTKVYCTGLVQSTYEVSEVAA